MFISKIALNGFKSFATKTELTFPHNIVSVVGPNGCGKSNIVDAFRWVLGEQKSSILRSDRMENVIFNGSENKKPVNFAEVSITFDNTTKILPVDYSEVVISRRLFRSGESEYVINKNVGRLKDITNLIMDTGIGTNAYSIMELKMVESILSEKYEERLKIFEEAAGISKYKNQRNATFRKLDSTKQDILRVNDIISEVERTVANLKRQVKKVDQYDKLNTKLKRKKYLILHYEISINEKELKRRKHTIGQLETTLSKSFRDVDVEEAKTETKKKELIDLEKKLGARQLQLNQKIEEISKTENLINISKERKSHLQSELVRLKKEGSILHTRTENLKMRKIEVSQMLEDCINGLSTAKSDYQNSEIELKAFMEKYGLKKEEISSLRTKLIETLKNISEKTRIRDRIKKEISDKEQREQSLFTERENLKAEFKNKRNVLSDYTAQRNKLFENHSQIKEKIEFLSTEIKNLEDSLIQVKEEFLKQSSFEEKTRNHLEFLENLIESKGELTEGEKFLINKKDSVKGFLGTVGELIDTEAKYKTAVENALGNTLNFLVFDNIAQAKEAVELLNKTKQGKATVIPLDLISEIYKSRSVTSETLPSSKLTPLSEVIETSAKYEHLVKYLSTDIFLTDSFNLNEIKKFKDRKIADLTGNIYYGNGIFKSGSPETKKISLIGRQKEITQVKKNLELCAKQQEEFLEKENKIREKINSENIKLNEHHKQFEILGDQLQKAERDISVLEFDIEKDKENFLRLKGELKQLELFETHLKDIEEIESEVQQLESERIELEKTMEDIKKTEISLEEERKVHENNRLDKKLFAAKKEEELIRFEKEKQRYEEDLKETKSNIEKIEIDFEKAKVNIASLEKELVTLDKKISLLLREKDEKEAERNKFSTVTESLREEVVDLENKLKILRNEKDEINAKVYDEKLEISKIQEKISLLRESQRKNGFLSEEKLEEEAFDLEMEKEELEKLEERVRSFGPMNLLAIDDYNIEKERQDFLRQQRNDLIEAEKSLLTTIEKINITAMKRFKTTFERIRKNFSVIFTKFFENGEADLILNPTDDPLDYKIDVISRPFGKKITSTALLSGGEKALTAIILLFAIYQEKPSPFCILDEVDAPLDDENISRFIRVLKEFAKDTQFIIVTHNKLTMESSDFLYGITMEETGISKAVSVDINTS